MKLAWNDKFDGAVDEGKWGFDVGNGFYNDNYNDDAKLGSMAGEAGRHRGRSTSSRRRDRSRSGSRIQDPGSRIQDPGSRIQGALHFGARYPANTFTVGEHFFDSGSIVDFHVYALKWNSWSCSPGPLHRRYGDK